MSRVDDLIVQLCPDGVEYKPLSELFDTRGGYTPSKSKSEYWENGTIPWFRMEDIRANGRLLSDALQYINESAVKKAGLFPAGSIIVATSATVGEHALLEVDALANQRFTCLTLKPKYAGSFLSKFLYHYCFLLDEYCLEHLTQGSFPSVHMSSFIQFEFPMVPIEIQREIVRVLDSFAELEAELEAKLEAELEARRAQYAYYRDKLLSECDSIKWVGLLDLATDCNRARKPIKQEVRVAGDTPYYGASGIVDYVDGFTHEGDYLLVSEDGANLVTRTYPIAFQIHGRNWVNNHAHVLQIDNEKELKLVEIYLNSISLDPYISRGAQPKLTKKKLGDIAVPVPSDADLDHIVAILDRFNVLISDMSQGLPAEIEARRKQYAYYRDKLLSFKEKVA